MKSVLAAALAAVLCIAVPAGARADTLIDRVEGLTLDEQGAPVRFTGLLVGNDGRVLKLLGRTDKRPKKVDYLLDGKGRVMIPGLIAAHADLGRLGIALLLAKPSVRREDGAMPAGKPRPEDLDVALAEVQAALLARGVTGVTDMGTTIEQWQAYRRAGDAGSLRLRIMSYAAGIDAMILIGGPGPTPWLYEDRLRMAGVVLDGSDSAGDTRLRNMLSRAAMDRFQPAVRAPGPASLGGLLDALGELAETYKGERRWRAEAVREIAPADLPRLSALGVMLVTQAAPDGETGLPDPFAAMAAMLGWSAPEGQPAARRTREDALAAWTVLPARAAFAETRLGRLAEGQRADFLLIDRDPMLSSPAEIAQTRVLETWIDGRRVWRADEPPKPERQGGGG